VRPSTRRLTSELPQLRVEDLVQADSPNTSRSSPGASAIAVPAGSPSTAQIGVTIDLVAFEPRSGTEEHAAAVRRLDGSRNRWILDPVLRGQYRQDTLDRFSPLVPPVEDGDLRTVAAPIDFLGINYYRRNVVRAGSTAEPVVVENEGERTAMGWEVYPNGLLELLVR
jgi:beta-glucosidase